MDSVPSPPMQARASRPRLFTTSTASWPRSTVWRFSPSPTYQAKGLAVLLVPRIVPPCMRRPETSSPSSLRYCFVTRPS